MKDRITENQLQLITKDKKLSEMIEGITQIRDIVREKMKQIRDYFDEHNEYLINFDRCFKSNWLNKNKGIAIVRAEINEMFEVVAADFEKLKEHFEGEPCYMAIIDRYQDTLDYNNTYQYGVSLVNKALEAATAQNVTKTTNTSPSQQQSLKQPENNTQNEQVYIRTFKVKVTREQAFALADFMNANNIEFESIKL